MAFRVSWGPRIFDWSELHLISNRPRIYVQDVHFAGLLDVQNILSADTGISRKTEGHSFNDHLFSGSVSITTSSVIEVSNVLCSVSLWLVWVMSIQTARWTPVLHIYLSHNGWHDCACWIFIIVQKTQRGFLRFGTWASQIRLRSVTAWASLLCCVR
jgi:hypothetical protein